MKHSKRPTEQESKVLAGKIMKNKTYLSRFLALMDGVRLIDDFEKNKEDDDKTDIAGDSLLKYIDSKAPMIEFELSLKKNITI